MIRHERVKRGLTQSELASRIGVTRQTVARIERDASDTTVATLANALRVLDVQLLVPEAEHEHSHEPPGTSALGLVATLALETLAPQVVAVLEDNLDHAVPQQAMLEIDRALKQLPQFFVPPEALTALQEHIKAAASLDQGPSRELTRVFDDMRRAALAQREVRR